MKNPYARLFDKVCYVSRDPQEVTNLLGEKINVFDTFPYDPRSKTTPKTAQDWAKRSWRYDHTGVDKPERPITTTNNEPFRVTILSLEVRSEGGRAYKVIDDQNRRFDLREDQLIEAFKLVGVNPGGQINGEFVWGTSSSQTKMVLIGGKLHAEMSETATEIKTTSPISLTKLKAGNVYKQRSQKELVYLGRVSHPKLGAGFHAFTDFPFRSEKHYVCNDDNTHTVVDVDPNASLQELYDLLGKNRWCNDITLMKSPKVFEEVGGTVDVAPIIANADLAYTYVNGNGENLAEALFEKENGAPRRPYYNSCYPYGGYGHRNTYPSQSAYNEAVASDQRRFRDDLTWK